MTREECLNAAKQCVCQDRESQYGKPENNFSLIAELWGNYLYGRFGIGVGLKGKDVAAMMALLKIARIATGKFKEDSWVDLIGYAACGCEIQSFEEIPCCEN